MPKPCFVTPTHGYDDSIRKLQSLSVSDGLTHLIDNFLTDRKCCVKMGGRSDYRAITMGAPQGTKLGPWFWLVYLI